MGRRRHEVQPRAAPEGVMNPHSSSSQRERERERCVERKKEIIG